MLRGLNVECLSVREICLTVHMWEAGASKVKAEPSVPTYGRCS